MTLEEFCRALFAKRDGVGTWEWECWILGNRPQTTCAYCKRKMKSDEDPVAGLLLRNIQRYWFHKECMDILASRFVVVRAKVESKAS